MNGTKSYSDAMHRYVKHLLALHHLYLAGKSESDEADEVRDEMDGPWREMTSHEIAITDGLSADLYSIGQNINLSLSEDRKLEFEAIKFQLSRMNWVTTLDLARKYSAKLSSGEQSYLRGTCWSELGFPDVSVEFLRDMINQGPVSVLEQSAYFSALQDIKEYDEADEFASNFNEETHPFLWMQYGTILSSKAFEESESNAAEIQKAIQVELHALNLSSKCNEERITELGITFDKWQQLILELELNLALLYYCLNDTSSSKSHVESILRNNQNHPEALLIKNQLLSNLTTSHSRLIGKWIANRIHPRITLGIYSSSTIPNFSSIN